MRLLVLVRDQVLAFRDVHHHEVSTLARKQFDWQVELLEFLGVHVTNILELFADSLFIGESILVVWEDSFL